MRLRKTIQKSLKVAIITAPDFETLEEKRKELNVPDFLWSRVSGVNLNTIRRLRAGSPASDGSVVLLDLAMQRIESAISEANASE